jgi:hypothetical protein
MERLRDLLGRFLRLRKPRRLQTLPYEELPAYYRVDPRGVSHEFMRRLHKIVCRASVDYALRNPEHGKMTSDQAAELTVRAFQGFAPEFLSGKPETLLLRFAGVMRQQVLDATAFLSIRRLYYHQLPLYHLKNDEQRRLLAAFYDEALDPTRLGQVAAEAHLSVDETKRIIKEANQALNRVISNRFKAADLRNLTENLLP